MVETQTKRKKPLTDVSKTAPSKPDVKNLQQIKPAEKTDFSDQPQSVVYNPTERYKNAPKELQTMRNFEYDTVTVDGETISKKEYEAMQSLKNPRLGGARVDTPGIQKIQGTEAQRQQKVTDEETRSAFLTSQRKKEIETQVQAEQIAERKAQLSGELSGLGQVDEAGMTPTDYRGGDFAEIATAGGVGLGAGAATGALTGAAIGSVVPVAGTAVGGAVGGIIGGIGGLITGTYSAFSSAKKQNVKESKAGFTNAKLSINKIITATNKNEISPSQAIELYNGALRDIKQARVDLKQQTQGDLLAFVAAGGDELIAVEAWLENEAMYRGMLESALISPNPSAIPTYEQGVAE